jgi:hypothetical protein
MFAPFPHAVASGATAIDVLVRINGRPSTTTWLLLATNNSIYSTSKWNTHSQTVLQVPTGTISSKVGFPSLVIISDW